MLYVATRTGFEPVISALTGQYVKPLHHRAVLAVSHQLLTRCH